MVQRTKLELQFDEPVEVELLYDECIEGTSQYGDYYLYAVRVDEQEYSFFATVEVHSELKLLSRGDKAIITKTSAQNGDRISAQYEVEFLNKDGKVISSEANSQPQKKSKKEDSFYSILLNSYTDALKIQSELNGLVDVNKIAITLFIARSRQSNYQ